MGDLPDVRRTFDRRGNCTNEPDSGPITTACNHQLVSSPATRLAEFGHLPSDQAGRTGLLAEPKAKDVRDAGRVRRPDTGNGMAESTFEHRAMGAFDRSGHGFESRQYFQDWG